MLQRRETSSDMIFGRHTLLAGHLSLPESKNSSCNVGTQAPLQLDIQGTSTPTAYKAILSDISYQVNLLQTKLSTVTTPDKLLSQCIADQGTRCTSLHSTLASRRAQYSKDIADRRNISAREFGLFKPGPHEKADQALHREDGQA